MNDYKTPYIALEIRSMYDAMAAGEAPTRAAEVLQHYHSDNNDNLLLDEIWVRDSGLVLMQFGHTVNAYPLGDWYESTRQALMLDTMIGEWAKGNYDKALKLAHLANLEHMTRQAEEDAAAVKASND